MPVHKFISWARSKIQSIRNPKDISVKLSPDKKPVKPLPKPTKDKPRIKGPKYGRLSIRGRFFLAEIKVHDGEMSHELYEELQGWPFQERVEVLKRLSKKAYESYNNFGEKAAFDALPTEIKHGLAERAKSARRGNTAK